MIQGLPPESATWSDGWSRTDELLATMVDVTQGWGWAITETLRRAHFKKPKPLPPPPPVEHPARRLPEPARPQLERATAPQIKQFFATYMSPN